MADLNEPYDWAQVTALGYKGQKQSEIVAAFLGTPLKVKILPGTRLCRGNFGKDLREPITAWWSYFSIPSGAMGANNDVGFATRVSFARTMRVTVREVIRLFLAVSEDFNSLEWLVRIKLMQPVWGWYGAAAQQARLNTGGTSAVKAGEGKGTTKNIPGHGYQFYLPNLTPKLYTMEDSIEIQKIESGLENPV
ncbi:MAG: hypothetical protein HY293_03550 [Planctomycetes bacterium]|nr:hypothetical protein [Planctomycetota bacterium]